MIGKFAGLGFAALTAVALAAPAPSKRAAAPAPVVAADTEHGFRFGSVTAKTRLVEYGSLNCPHCAAFAKVANPAIIRAVKSGALLYEYRPIALFPQDLATHALVKCVPVGQRLSFIDDYYRSQSGVYGKIQAATATQAAVDALNKDLAVSETRAAQTLARVGGMAPIAARHGLPASQANACLASARTLKWVGDATAAANSAGVSSTPTFEYNGQRTEIVEVLAKLGAK